MSDHRTRQISHIINYIYIYIYIRDIWRKNIETICHLCCSLKEFKKLWNHIGTKAIKTEYQCLLCWRDSHLFVWLDRLSSTTCNWKYDILFEVQFAMHSQKAVSAYFTSKQILPFGFAEYSLPIETIKLKVSPIITFLALQTTEDLRKSTLTLSSLNLPLSSSSTTCRELLSQFLTCSGWKWFDVV